MLLHLASLALAAPCPDISEQVEAAWEAFDDAELADAKAMLTAATASLGCQEVVVEPEVLLGLYRLDALASLALDDRKGVVYAMIRAVAVDHETAQPPESYGPELADLYDTWSARLSETLITVHVQGGGVVYVDGREATMTDPLSVVEGEHLVQVPTSEGGYLSTVSELSADHVVRTVLPAPEGVEPIDLDAEDPVEEEPAAAAPSPIEPAAAPRRRPLPFFIAGGASLALGTAALLTGWRSEVAFKNAPYMGPEYAGCTNDRACYEEARQLVINRDALRIRVAYGLGYGLTGVGAGLLGVGAVGLPASGATVGISGRW
jgi:hypothetical protein